MRKFLVFVALATLVPASASAGSIFGDSLPTKNNNPTTVLVEDANKEFITKGVGNTDPGFQVGDTVTLFLDFETIAGGPFNGGSFDAEGFGPDYRLWANGVFEVTSIDVTSAPGDTRIGNIDFGGSLDFYETTTGGDLFASGTISGAQTVLNTAGPSIFTLGIAPGSDDFITAFDAFLDFADIPAATSSNSVTADFGLSQIGGDPLPVAPISLSDIDSTLHQFIGDIETRLAIEFDGDSEIGDGDDQFDLRTNAAFSFQSVPEPGSIAIWATLALGGCLAARRRLASKS